MFPNECKQTPTVEALHTIHEVQILSKSSIHIDAWTNANLCTAKSGDIKLSNNNELQL